MGNNIKESQNQIIIYEGIVRHYNLEVIISVVYRVKSIQGTKFHQWATARLREYLVQGFTMNDEFLKNNGDCAK